MVSRWLVPAILILGAGCASGQGTSRRDTMYDEGVGSLSLSYESVEMAPTESQSIDSNAPCQENDPRLECRRTLHHYTEFERSTQSEIYQTGGGFNR